MKETFIYFISGLIFVSGYYYWKAGFPSLSEMSSSAQEFITDAKTIIRTGQSTSVSNGVYKPHFSESRFADQNKQPPSGALVLPKMRENIQETMRKDALKSQKDMERLTEGMHNRMIENAAKDSIRNADRALGRTGYGSYNGPK